MPSVLPGLIRSSCLAGLIAGALMLSSCGDERSSGMIVTSDGGMFANSASNTRLLAQRNIDHNLLRYLGDHWRSQTTIAQLPEWLDDHGLDADWRWTQCDAVVELIGDGSHGLPISADEIRDGVHEYLQGRVEQSRHHLTVTVRVLTDPQRFAAVLHPPKAQGDTLSEPPAIATATPVAVTTAAPAGPRTYEVQLGDTLADISIAFYGSSRYWKLIVKANPDLDPTNLTVGQRLVIPALSADATQTTQRAPVLTQSLVELRTMQQEAMKAVTQAMTAKDLALIASAKKQIALVREHSEQFHQAALASHWSEDEINQQFENLGMQDLYAQQRLLDDLTVALSQQSTSSTPSTAPAVTPTPAPAP
jgi:LysM repeat protein